MKKNIMLKTFDEVTLFTKRIKREIAINEKHTFLILSKKSLFELNKLENYLYKNTLNDLAKTKLLNCCTTFIELDNEYQNIKAKEPIDNYHFISDYAEFKGTFCNKIMYFLYSENGLLKINKEKFNELFQTDLYFENYNQQIILKHCKHILELIKPEAPQQRKIDKEKYKNYNMFKVGLLFATGEMDKYFTVNAKNETIFKKGYSAPIIAKELKNESYNKYILATINNYTKDNSNGNKNIFNLLEMMTNIIDHCEKENLNVTSYFKSRLPIE